MEKEKLFESLLNEDKKPMKESGGDHAEYMAIVDAANGLYEKIQGRGASDEDFLILFTDALDSSDLPSDLIRALGARITDRFTA